MPWTCVRAACIQIACPALCELQDDLRAANSRSFMYCLLTLLQERAGRRTFFYRDLFRRSSTAGGGGFTGLRTTVPGSGGGGGAFLPLGRKRGHFALSPFFSVEATGVGLMFRKTKFQETASSLGLLTGRALEGQPRSWCKTNFAGGDIKTLKASQEQGWPESSVKLAESCTLCHACQYSESPEAAQDFLPRSCK